MWTDLARRAPAAGPAPLVLALALLALDPLATTFALPEIASDLGVVPEDLHRAVLAPGLYLGAAAVSAWLCAKRAVAAREVLLVALAVNVLALLVAAGAGSLAPYLCARVLGGAAAGAALAVAPVLLGGGRIGPPLWAAFAAAPILAPALLSMWSWRGFYVVLALAAAPCLLWALRRAPRVHTEARPGVRPPLAGAALATVVVYVPLFARATRDTGSIGGAAGAAWRTVLAFVFVAWVGKRLLRLASVRTVAVLGCVAAAGGLVAMSAWNSGALRGPGHWIALIVVGAGLGATARALTRPAAWHLPGWLLGAAAGVWAVTMSGQARFNDLLGRIPDPADLCPTGPGQCAPYELQVRVAALEQFQTVFLTAALCAALAGVLLAVGLAPRREPAAST